VWLVVKLWQFKFADVRHLENRHITIPQWNIDLIGIRWHFVFCTIDCDYNETHMTETKDNKREREKERERGDVSFTKRTTQHVQHLGWLWNPHQFDMPRAYIQHCINSRCNSVNLLDVADTARGFIFWPTWQINWYFTEQHIPEFLKDRAHCLIIFIVIFNDWSNLDHRRKIIMKRRPRDRCLKSWQLDAIDLLQSGRVDGSYLDYVQSPRPTRIFANTFWNFFYFTLWYYLSTYCL